MDERERKPSGNEPQIVAGDTFHGSERLFAAFSRTSAIGFAVLDEERCYQAINKRLATINGLAPELHLGVSVREIFGEVSEIAEPSYHRVLDLGHPSHFEVKDVVLPTRPSSHFSALNTNFPILDRAGRVRHIGILLVEVTQQRKLEAFLHKLTAELHHIKTQETFWLTRELQASIDQYHAALATNLDLLVRDQERSIELLAQSIEILDQRIISMGILVDGIATHFPIDR
jgi:transcriptional regulator with PAS, ATPase and Fis domain